jgi:hypothetical protein
MTIIQLEAHPSGTLYGLGDDGLLYQWNSTMFTWDEVKRPEENE